MVIRLSRCLSGYLRLSQYVHEVVLHRVYLSFMGLLLLDAARVHTLYSEIRHPVLRHSCFNELVYLLLSLYLWYFLYDIYLW